MTTPKFTPGPYTWVEHDGYPATDLVSADGTVIFQIYESHGGGKMPDEAHQRLIAAAPEMYGALSQLINEYVSNVDPYRTGGFYFPPDKEDIIIEARAALAKANPDD